MAILQAVEVFLKAQMAELIGKGNLLMGIIIMFGAAFSLIETWEWLLVADAKWNHRIS